MSNHKSEEAIIDNVDRNLLSLEDLKLLQSTINKVINFKKHDLKLAPSSDHLTENTTQGHEYKANLAKVFPHHLRNSLSEYKKCVFIISLESKNFVDRQRLRASIKWISTQFQACIVLVCDSIYRLTLEVRDQSKDDESRLKAFHIGQEFLNQNTSLFEQYSEGCNFQFKLASEIEKKTSFEAYHQEFQRLYQTSESFSNLVISFAEIYIGRVEQIEEEKVEVRSLHKKKQLAIAYLLEESALITCLGEEGWPVFVYPGSIKTFEEIAEGLHPEVPVSLKQMIWISLRLKKK
ncbi:MAG: tRNA-dependent cyclodipeptide synthase [Scytonema sp. PMC 1069.18]|nr:tRNA-dependent cyclodipeptide synthase [Scytonema sp. PMC 1069.18]MEC4881676.1 tRNA-dependent cyclodipeptide synthase [Scytonema sp. PMC 1070.18]